MIATSDHKVKTQPTSGRRPLRVAVYLADQNPHRDRSLGITSMTRTLMEQLALHHQLALTQIISRSSYAQSLRSIETCRIPLRTDRVFGRLISDAIHPWIVHPKVDLWYYPKGYVSKYAAPFQPSIGTMHDTIVQHYADHYPASRSARAFRYWIDATKQSLRCLSRVMTVSDHAANQLRIFCDRYDIVPPEIEVTFESSSWEQQREVHRQKDDCVVHLASTAAHKCTNRLLQLWRQLQQRRTDLPRLDLIGRLDDSGARLCESIKNVRLSNPQATELLQESIGKSRAVLLPSEIEGFGLPALEGYYVGTPTCFVTGTSVVEVVQEQGRAGGFTLEDVDSFETALDWALSLSDETVRMIGDAMYTKFSTTQITQRVIDAFYRTASC